MSASGKPEHGDAYTDGDGMTRIVFETPEGVYQNLFITNRGTSWLDSTTRPAPFVPKDSVYKFNLADIISNILKDSHEHSD
jgi:hypothetical protein